MRKYYLRVALILGACMLMSGCGMTNDAVESPINADNEAIVAEQPRVTDEVDMNSVVGEVDTPNEEVLADESDQSDEGDLSDETNDVEETTVSDEPNVIEELDEVEVEIPDKADKTVE